MLLEGHYLENLVLDRKVCAEKPRKLSTWETSKTQDRDQPNWGHSQNGCWELLPNFFKLSSVTDFTH